MADEDNIPDGDGGKPQPVVMPPVDTNQRHFDAGGNPTPILPPEPEQSVPRETVPQEQPPATPDYKLWSELNKTQLYTKPYSDFQKQFNNNQSVDRLYQNLNESQLYTKGKDDFYNQFFQHLPSPEVQNANKFLTDIVKTPQANLAIDKLTGDQAANQFYAQQANQSEGKDATRISQPFIGRLPSTVEDDRKEFVQNANDNPDMLRSVTKELKRQSKDPELNKKIDIANYTLDANARPHSDAVVKYNIGRLSNPDDLQYDEVNKQLVKPEGMLGSTFRAMKNHSDALDEYDYLTSHSDDDIIKHLDEKNANYDPDKPVYKAIGTLPSVGEMVGSNLSAGLKLGSGSIAGKLAGAVAPELSLPIAAITTMGMGMGVTDFHHTQYANALQQSYQDIINKHPGIDKHIALQQAKDNANFSGALAMGQALVMGEVGNKLANETELNPVSLGAGKLKTVKDVLTNIVKQSKSIAPDALGQASIAAGVKAVDNHFQGKPMADGGGDAFMGTLAMMGMLGLVKAPDAFIGGAGKRNVMDILAKAPEGTVDNLAAAHNALGTMTPETAAAAKNEVNIHKAQTEGMPDVTSPLTPEAEHILKLSDEGSKIFMNKDLEKVARENGIKAEEGKELSVNNIIDQLRSKQGSAKQPPTFEKPNLGAGLSDIYKSQYETDPEGFMKMVAEQAHGGVNHPVSGEFTSSRPETEKTFGPEMVKAATEKYPEHIINEPKVSEDLTPGKGESIQPNSDKIEPNKDFQTWDLGDMAGKPEDEAAKKHIEGVVKAWDTKPAAGEPEAKPAETEDLDAKKQSEIDEAVKPEIKLQKISPTDLAKPDEAVELKSRHDEIWGKYKELKDIVNCIWQ